MTRRKRRPGISAGAFFVSILLVACGAGAPTDGETSGPGSPEREADSNGAPPDARLARSYTPESVGAQVAVDRSETSILIRDLNPGEEADAEAVEILFEDASRTRVVPVVLEDEEGRREELRFRVSEGTDRLVAGSRLLGFAPTAVLLSAEEDGAAVRFGESAYERPQGPYPALRADLGFMNFASPARWRRADFELYAWVAAPSILVFDFADYEVQRAMFGRLGFFVAVVGEMGTVRPEAEYEGRHSYNAHDYRPEDLLRFYRTAEESGVALNEYELLLKDILLEYGILVGDPAGGTGNLGEGRGAVTSFSQETWRPLRQRLLRHEAYHGLFYTSQDFADGVFEVWSRMSDPEKDFFRFFLGNKGLLDGRPGYDGYAVSREYLLVNEMQAHVLQLLPSEVADYYRHYANRLSELVPDSRAVVADILPDLPAFVTRLRRELEEVVYAATGIPQGRLMAVYPEGAEILD